MDYGILFSGQGAQKPGMGLDFLSDSLFKETIEIASDASQKDILTIFKSEKDELSKTENVQPALVAFECGIYRMLKRDCPNLSIKGMVGLSLGEYAAMFASGAIDLKDGIALVSDRARYMQEDANKIDNGMSALLKPKLDEITDILADLQADGQKVYLANYNSPKQVVIAGEKQAVDIASQKIKSAEAAKKVINLRVNGAFHTPLFNNARQKMHRRLQSVSFKQNSIPVISNTTADIFDNNWTEIMEKQLAVPTHFGKCVKHLVYREVIDATLEIGPGKVLSSFAKQIDHKLKCQRIGNFEEYQQFVEGNNGN